MDKMDKIFTEKKVKISFDDLRLFFEDDANIDYDLQDGGFINQFLAANNYEVIKND